MKTHARPIIPLIEVEEKVAHKKVILCDQSMAPAARAYKVNTSHPTVPFSVSKKKITGTIQFISF